MEEKYSKEYLIKTGIGLQDVDKLKNSQYFIDESNRYINGEISLEELEELVFSYYKTKPEEEKRSEEADVVANRIADYLSSDSFVFSVGQLVAIHKRLFEGVFNHAGKLREYNFVKKEWVLDGATVYYADHKELEATLQFDLEAEKKFNYLGLSKRDIVEHLSIFISNLWQIHPFEEGNTRTTAVFVIKYLRSLGFDVTNDIFAENAWFFRNALVRANYRNITKGIVEDRLPLKKFLLNLLFNEHNKLSNRELHVSYKKHIPTTYRERDVLKIIDENPYITSEELASQMSLSIRTIKALLRILTDKGLIERRNGKRYGYWEIKNRN